MKKYQVTVNGEIFLVEVEELSGSEAAPAIAFAPKPAPATVSMPKAASASAPAQTGGAGVNSPLPGTIVKILVENGQAVKAGDLLLVLEAMKMENDILASGDGVVTLKVKVGDAVQSGDLLVSLAG